MSHSYQPHHHPRYPTNAAPQSVPSQRDRKQHRSHKQPAKLELPYAINDFSTLQMKEGSESRPLWVCPSGHIFLETFSPFYEPAYDFLIAIAEPVCRPELIHEYKITKYSLYAAASVGLQTDDLIDGLKKLSKNVLDPELVEFIAEKTRKCGKLRMILKNGRYFLESSDEEVLTFLINKSSIMYNSLVKSKDFEVNERGWITNLNRMENDNEEKLEIDAILNPKNNDNKNANTNSNNNPIDSTLDSNNTTENMQSFAFEIKEAEIEAVKQSAHDLQYPCVEEYDFRNDAATPKLEISLKAIAKHRPYQEKCLSKMFGNGRARSGLIVLPCGAGKTLVGVTAVATVKKSAIIFANTTVSVHQWFQQILHWSRLVDRSCIVEFSSQSKNKLPPKTKACILVTTYHMLGHSGRRSKEAQVVMDEITSREWGLLVLDEVHVAPANTFRKCTSMIRSKCKLGLTATLLREDDKIGDLFYLIGPKLYEANWLDLQKNGYLALVQCIEVWCEMAEDFYHYYLYNEQNNKRYSQLLSDFNPNKFRCMQYLMRVHEQRGDKVLVFSDNIPLLKHCAKKLCKPFIYGKTGDQERKYWLHNFNHTASTNCLFISSVGDTSLDLPDVNVVIQISSHYGSRRQEAQRLGRILRPKPRQGNEFNAFFYTLVSKDTVDMVYATKRQRFLVDQGYSFHVITDLVNENTPDLHYQTQHECNQLLSSVLTLIKSNDNLAEFNANGDDGGDNEDEDDDLTAVRKTGKDMSALTDGSGLRYNEFAPKTSKLSSARGLLSANNTNHNMQSNTNAHNTNSNAPKRGKKRKKEAATKFFQKRAKERKTLDERRKMYLPH
eukprot:CAMPEP_0197030694 /NCGR_PEP_ID=MMETSP1384-20130603/9872_1 /TAXON_ID=29189 /ORGANISM="Ammonia sp." /LENGTH=835 /DNA_ID=CAMNT_0042460091 /DNA_START=86 /DNA_END=2593 /DNA_ORIENTATION=+